MENKKIEIADICAELENSGSSGVLRERTADACTQAASLLSRMRKVILTGLSKNWYAPSDRATQEIVEKLKLMLVEQQDG